jgi:hypothetical protein
MVNVNNLVKLYVEVQNDVKNFRFLSEVNEYIKNLPENEEGRLKAMYALGIEWVLFPNKPWGY